MFDKTYQPSAVEARLYQAWESCGAFRAGRKERLQNNAKPYCIVIPPPNVTGSLHMGHALNNTLQDILARFERMRGRDVLWLPGMDHAGIATQSVVERQLMQRQEPDRRAMGRIAFIKRIWEWKAESGGIIINQLKRLGCSCDWSRERFTMDEGLSRAVIEVFVKLYRAGLIYKDKRLVNWDPKLQTAISDLEVNAVETKGKLWYFNYPVKDAKGKRKHITVATTRPETMLGDTAVAVHPKDKRYKSLIGKTCILPLVGREIPIIADEYADPEQGSGAVKITPGHDFNDFEVGRRNDLEIINIFDAQARLNGSVPEEYRGLDRFEARKRVVADLEVLGLVEKIEDHIHMLPYGDRSNEVIEPWQTDQWYVDAKKLAGAAIEAVERGRTVFVPRNWEKTYFDWMRKIQPWCISRQLWWGHQIPVWYGRKKHPDPKGTGLHTIPFELEHFCAETEAEAIEQAESYFGKPVKVVSQPPEFRAGWDPSKSKWDVHGPTGPAEIWRDEDVLDTWFSSALWPFSTLGWPEDTPELKRYYPTDVLVTGFDIIFFWVARMMMMGLHFMEEVPFRTVYIHALVRDEKGQKMSKSKGNIIDPLEVIDQYGADALRFTLAAMAAQGRDIKLAAARVEGYRNFATKLWNAARFTQMNGCVRQAGFDPAKLDGTLNRWIAGETERVTRAVTGAIELHRYNEAAGAVYQFVWHLYCDWYLEFIKPVLSGAQSAAKSETQATAAWALEQILKLLHPFMPFITEELWERLAEEEERASMLILASWPKFAGLEDARAAGEINWLIRLITEIRSARSEMNVPLAAKLDLVMVGAGETIHQRADKHAATIARLARLSSIEFAGAAPKGSIQIVLDEATLALPLEGVIDIKAECERLKKEISKAGAEIEKLGAKLANEQFIARAPGHVVEENRERKAEAEQTAARLREALRRIGAA